MGATKPLYQALHIERVIDCVDKKLIDKMPKLDVLFKFPNLYLVTQTSIVLKQPKTEGSVRTLIIPGVVVEELYVLKVLQERLKLELGSECYMEYDLVICQANGRPLMTEHLNKRFKVILIEINSPDIDVDDIVFHSIRQSSTTYKLKLNHGDLKATQGDSLCQVNVGNFLTVFLK